MIHVNRRSYPYMEEVNEGIVREFRRLLPVTGKVLDVGCGRGQLGAAVRELGGHHVPVVALREGEEHVRILRAGPPEDVLVGTVAPDGAATEARREPVEGGRRVVDDDDLVAGKVVDLGQGRADTAASHDHDLHSGERSARVTPPRRRLRGRRRRAPRTARA